MLPSGSSGGQESAGRGTTHSPLSDPRSAGPQQPAVPAHVMGSLLGSTASLSGPWPGVSDGHGGLLRDDVDDFGQLLNTTASRFGVEEGALVRDYHMCRALRALFARHRPGIPFEDRYNDHKGRPVTVPVGPLVFAGGSSLTNAYRLADRLSEDIDLSVVAETEIASKNASSRIRRLAVVAAARACSPELPDDAHDRRSSGGDIGRRGITVGDARGYIVAEASLMRPFDPGVQARLDTASGGRFDVWRIVRCQSLMGRAADGDTLARYSELAAFTVAALCVPVTACNKFFALHRRAMAEPTDDTLAALTTRSRDIYDLWSIAESPAQADEVRRTVALIAGHIEAKGSTSEPHRRPDRGFASSPAFDPATDQYAALEAGYREVLSLVWGRRPKTFAEAVTAIKTLDP